MKYTIQALLNIVYLHQIDDENSTFENFEILNQFTFYIKCICFFNHSNFKTVYNFLSFVYDSWTQDLKILQSSSCYRHVNLYKISFYQKDL